LRVTAGKSGVLPLADFVQLYVKLRHPHHYDPASWHWGLWVSFLWPVPLAIAWWRQHGWDAMAWMMLAITGLIAVALVGAGIWYFHESLVQMSLYRFSIYPKLVACIGAAMLLMRRAEVTRFAVGIIVLVTLAGAMGLAGRMEIVAQNLPAIAGFCAIALLSLGWRVMSMPVAAVALAVLAIALEILLWDRLGIRVLHREPAGYWQVVEYAREHTPVDAVFLVPPEENVMRLHGQRAIVVNLKGVPQLSGEMVDWKNRMQAVLNVDDLSQFQTGLFTQTLSQMGNRYAELSEDVLTATARQFGARYIVARKPFAKRTPLIASADDGYFLYDLQSSGD
jgi:hypothetical protein